LSTLFQVDLKIIRIIRSEDFGFGFTEDVDKFVIVGKGYLKGQESPQVMQSWPIYLKSKDRVEICWSLEVLIYTRIP